MRSQPLTDYHVRILAHEFTQRCASDSIDKLAPVLADAQVDLDLLKDGCTLTEPIETLTLVGKTVHSIAGGEMLLCLEEKLTLELIRTIAERKPSRVVRLDAGFSGNDQLEVDAAKLFQTRSVARFKTV